MTSQWTERNKYFVEQYVSEKGADFTLPRLVSNINIDFFILIVNRCFKRLRLHMQRFIIVKLFQKIYPKYVFEIQFNLLLFAHL